MACTIAGTSGLLMGTNDSGVDLPRPVHIPRGVGQALQLLLDPRPGAVVVPPGKPVVAGLPRPVPLRHLRPRRTVTGPPQDPVDHLPMIPEPPSSLAPRRRQQRPESISFLVSQITRHAAPTAP